MKLFGRRVGDLQEQVENQREFERILMVLGAACRQRGNDFSIFTDDVSANGLRFLSQVPVVKDEPLLVFIPVSREGRRLPVKARVAWTREEGERQYVGGLEFVEMSDDARRQWVDFIEQNREDGLPAQSAVASDQTGQYL